MPEGKIILENRIRWHIVVPVFLLAPGAIFIAAIFEGVWRPAVILIVALLLAEFGILWLAVFVSRRSPSRVSLLGEKLIAERPALFGRGKATVFPISEITEWSRYRDRTIVGPYDGVRFRHAGEWYRMQITNAQIADIETIERLASGGIPTGQPYLRRSLSLSGES